MDNPSENDWATINARLSIKGRPLEMQMNVPAKPVKLTRMLPLFHALTNSFVNLGVQTVESQGEKISCRKGCGACCRQPVPIANVEALQIAELVENLPEPRRGEVTRRFAEGAARLHEIDWFERVGNCPPDAPQELQKLVDEYFRQGVACPFLVDESCSIHSERPLACREYLVTSPAENCSAPTPENVRGIPALFKSSAILAAMSSSESAKTFLAVPLIFALEWARDNASPADEKTGEQWMADFFRRATKSEIPASPEKKDT